MLGWTRLRSRISLSRKLRAPSKVRARAALQLTQAQCTARDMCADRAGASLGRLRGPCRDRAAWHLGQDSCLEREISPTQRPDSARGRERANSSWGRRPLPPVLTGLVDARVVAELQHVEVPALDAAADAVDAGDVGALALHAEQGLHQLLVAMVEEAEGGRPLEQEQSSHEGPQPPRHPPAAPGARTSSQARLPPRRELKVQTPTSSFQLPSASPLHLRAGGGGSGARRGPAAQECSPRPPARPPASPLSSGGEVSPRSSSLINWTANRAPQQLAVTAEEAQGWKTGCGGRRGCQALGERRAGERRGEGPAGGGLCLSPPVGQEPRGMGIAPGRPRCPHDPRSPARRGQSHRSSPQPGPGSAPRLLSCPISWGNRGGTAAGRSAPLPGLAHPAVPLLPRQRHGLHGPCHSWLPELPSWDGAGGGKSRVGCDAGVVC